MKIISKKQKQSNKNENYEGLPRVKLWRVVDTRMNKIEFLTLNKSQFSGEIKIHKYL